MPSSKTPQLPLRETLSTSWLSNYRSFWRGSGWEPYLVPCKGGFASSRLAPQCLACTQKLMDQPGVYEFALVKKGAPRRYKVYVGQSGKLRRRLHQEYRGASGSHLRPFFDEALANGCQIWTRCRYVATPEDALRVETDFLRRFDYAWNLRQAGCEARHVNIMADIGFDLKNHNKKKTNPPVAAVRDRTHGDGQQGCTQVISEAASTCSPPQPRTLHTRSIWQAKDVGRGVATAYGQQQSRWISVDKHAEDGEELSEKDFHRLSDLTLGELMVKLEALIEETPGIADSDLEYSQGVLTLNLGSHGTYVINKQAPNKQIWVSSPVSGPVRYDMVDGHWVYKHDGHVFQERLARELQEITGKEKVDLDQEPQVAQGFVGYGADPT